MSTTSLLVSLDMLQHPPADPTPIISISDLLNTIDIIKSKEAEDKTRLTTLFNVNEADLRNRLILWGTTGFPSMYTLYSFQLHRSETCSDGIARRDGIEYYNFLFPETPLQNVLMNIEQRLPGMTLTYSYTADFLLCVHISKKTP